MFVASFTSLRSSSSERSLTSASGAGHVSGRRGVWVEGSRKIASIGIAVDHWVTLHGFALNVDVDLGEFDRFHPCGFDGSVMTSLARETGRPVALADARPSVISAWQSSPPPSPRFSGPATVSTRGTEPARTPDAWSRRSAPASPGRRREERTSSAATCFLSSQDTIGYVPFTDIRHRLPEEGPEVGVGPGRRGHGAGLAPAARHRTSAWSSTLRWMLTTPVADLRATRRWAPAADPHGRGGRNSPFPSCERPRRSLSLATGLPYLVQKRRVDRALEQSRLSYAIVRPTMLFGPRDKLLTVMLPDDAPVPPLPDVRGQRSHLSPISFRDFARILHRETNGRNASRSRRGDPFGVALQRPDGRDVRAPRFKAPLCSLLPLARVDSTRPPPRDSSARPSFTPTRSSGSFRTDSAFPPMRVSRAPRRWSRSSIPRPVAFAPYSARCAGTFKPDSGHR